MKEQFPFQSHSFFSMKQADHQLLDVYRLEPSLYHTFHNQIFYTNHDDEHRRPILQPTLSSSPSSTLSYCFDPKKRSSKGRIVIQERPIKDYFRASLFSCITCFWMFAGIVCLFQSLKIRRLLRENRREEARRCSNRLHTNLILTYVFGGMIFGVLIMTILVTFVVGIKGYFSRSL